MNSGAPARTAEYMALFRALESVGPPDRRLFEDRSAQLFLGPGLRAVARAARTRPLRRPIIAYIDRRWPGPRPSGVVRTRVIDEFVTDASRDGATQLVLLGAGYDTRATRLPGLAAGRVFEVDHPATQARKREALGSLGRSVRYVPLDFECEPLAPALAAAGFDPGQRSCVVWEGVFSYLTLAAIDQTLEALIAACAPASTILLTYVDQRALDSARAGSSAWLSAVRDVGEPFQTGLDPSHAKAFFAARGLRLRSDESTADAARRLGTGDARAIPGFYRLAILEVDSFSEPGDHYAARESLPAPAATGAPAPAKSAIRSARMSG